MVSSIVERRTSSKQDKIQKFQFLFAVLRRTRSPYCSPLWHIANDNPTIPMSKLGSCGGMCTSVSIHTHDERHDERQHERPQQHSRAEKQRKAAPISTHQHRRISEASTTRATEAAKNHLPTTATETAATTATTATSTTKTSSKILWCRTSRRPRFFLQHRLRLFVLFCTNY